MKKIEKEISFEIAEAKPILEVGGKQIIADNYKAIVKQETHEVLSIMKKSYTPMSVAHFLETTHGLAEASNFPISGFAELRDGRIILAFLENKEEEIVIDGFKMKDYLVIGTSFDGTQSFFVGTTTEFYRCTNVFSNMDMSFKIKHTISAPLRITEKMLTLETYFNERKRMVENFNKMREIKIDAKTKAMLEDYMLNISAQDRLEEKISTKKSNQLILMKTHIESEMGELGQNVWGFFNGITSYTTHALDSKSLAYGNLFGLPARLNKKAYNKSLQLING